MIDTLTSGQLAVIRASVARMVVFAELELSTTLYLCTANRNVDLDGHTWIGLGAMAIVEPITEKSSLEAVAVRIGISGVPTENRSLALAEPIRGKACSVYVGFFDDNEAIIGSKVKEYAGILDAPQIITSEPDADGNRSAQITVTVEGILIDFSRPGRGRRHTNEDQQELYPGDLFYSLADDISKKSFPWGVPK